MLVAAVLDVVCSDADVVVCSDADVVVRADADVDVAVLMLHVHMVLMLLLFVLMPTLLLLFVLTLVRWNCSLDPRFIAADTNSHFEGGLKNDFFFKLVESHFKVIGGAC